jgi:hypothetical protein
MSNGAVARYDLFVPIVPSDTVNFDLTTMGGGPGGPWSKCCDAIWCGTPGTVTAVMQNDRAVQFTVVAGSLLQIAAKRVNATGTTATGLVALYQN